MYRERTREERRGAREELRKRGGGKRGRREGRTQKEGGEKEDCIRRGGEMVKSCCT